MIKYIPLLILASLSTSYGRLGETAGACNKRYGNPLNVDKEKQTIIWQKAGFNIAIRFYKEVAHQIYIQKTETNVLGRHKEISETEIATLLKANQGSSKFKKLDKTEVFDDQYATDDETRIANHNTIDHWLLISTVEYQKYLNSQKAEKEKENLDGF